MSNKHGDTLIDGVDAPTKANSWDKFEQDPWHIVGYSAVTIQNSKTSGQSVLVKFLKAANKIIKLTRNIP